MSIRIIWYNASRVRTTGTAKQCRAKGLAQGSDVGASGRECHLLSMSIATARCVNISIPSVNAGIILSCYIRLDKYLSATLTMSHCVLFRQLQVSQLSIHNLQTTKQPS